MDKELKKHIRRTNPVPSVSAQTNHLCRLDSNNGLSRITNIALQITKKTNPSYIDIIINLQASYGLRITEVLNIKGTDISPKGAIHITGLKGSENRIVQPTNDLEWWLRQRAICMCVFDGITRFTVYREYKKRNICINVEGRTKQAVTHAFRHIVINDLRNITKDEKEISKFSGHKASKNTQIYGKIKH